MRSQQLCYVAHGQPAPEQLADGDGGLMSIGSHGTGMRFRRLDQVGLGIDLGILNRSRAKSQQWSG